MFIAIGEGVQLEQVDDLTSFSIVSDLPLEKIDARLRSANLGFAAETHAWIDAEQLQLRASTVATSVNWGVEFEQMLELARRNGWWDTQHGAIQAHIGQSR